MAAVDFLPIAQPAARPDAAVARKSASAPDENGEASFAEVLETEAHAAPEAKPEDEAVPAEDSAAPAQPGTAPAATPAVTPVNAAAAILAAAPMILQAGGEPPETETTASQVAPGKTAVVPVALALPAGANARPDGAATTGTPVDQTASKTGAIPSPPPTPKADPATPAKSAGEQPVPDNGVEAGAPPVAPAPVKAAAPAASNDTELASSDPRKPEPSAARDPSPETETAQPAASAPVQPAASLQAAVAVAAVTAPVIAPLIAPKQPQPAGISNNAPGERRNANPVDSPAALAEAASAGKSGATAAVAVAAATPAASSETGRTQTQTTALGSDIAPDIKPDAPTPSSNASTTFADALAAARGSSVDAGRAQAANPHLQSAPSAAVQVYARFVERFDGRAQRFEVRLDPAELGRVDVRIEVGADKKVHAVLAAHDSAALSDLMRGQRSLERALSDAGIDLADNGLRFELSGDAGRNLAGQQRDDGWSNDELAHAWRAFSTIDVAVDANPADIAAATRTYSTRSSRLDLVA